MVIHSEAHRAAVIELRTAVARRAKRSAVPRHNGSCPITRRKWRRDPTDPLPRDGL